MTAKEHYDKHLGKVYSWMLGDFQERMSEQKDFFFSHGIVPLGNRLAFDLGAGNGIQSVALAKLGFEVHAVDFSKQLLDELMANRAMLPIHAFEKDVSSFLNETTESPELVICMGDTLTHFTSHDEVRKIIGKISQVLSKGGKLVVSWRDLSEERMGTERFLQVKSDDTRTLSCFLEYFPQHVMVHDLLLEKISGMWKQSVSSYPKLRIPVHFLREILGDNAMAILHEEMIRGMNYIVARKNQAVVTQ